MNMTFDFSDVTAMARTYQNGERIVRDEMTRGVERSVIQIEADAKRLVPTDTHTLQRSLTHAVETRGGTVEGRAGTNLQYARVVEEGRSAGAAMPPQGALLGWMRRHGIDPEAEFVVRRAIGRRGTRPQPYLKPALDKNRAAIGREMDAVLRRISQRLAQSA